MSNSKLALAVLTVLGMSLSLQSEAQAGGKGHNHTIKCGHRPTKPTKPPVPPKPPKPTTPTPSPTPVTPVQTPAPTPQPTAQPSATPAPSATPKPQASPAAEKPVEQKPAEQKPEQQTPAKEEQKPEQQAPSKEKQKEDKPQVQERRDDKPKRKLKAKLLPAFFLNFDWGTQVVNKTAYSPRLASALTSAVKQDFDASRDTLISGDYSGGFQVTKYQSVAAGVGANVMFYFENATGLARSAWGSIGLIPFEGRDMVSTRNLRTQQQAMTYPALSLPSKASDFSGWAQGDNVTYASNGGIIFSSSIGFASIGAGPTYVAQGTFQTYVEKVDTKNVYVRIDDVKINTLQAQASMSLATVSTSKFKSVSDGVSYMINIQDPDGAKAYNDLINGNVAGVQKYAQANPGGPVTKWEKINQRQSGRLNNFFFGIPILAYKTWTAGKIYDISSSQDFYGQSASDTQYGIYLKEKRSKLWDTHTSTTEAFYGAVVKVEDREVRNTTKTMFGQYTWSADDEASNHKDIRTAIKELVKKTGMTSLLVNLPTLTNLQYAKVNFTATLDESQTLKVMNKINSMSEYQFKSLVNKKAEEYTRGTDIWELCRKDEGMSSCDMRIKWTANDSAEKMYSAVGDMSMHVNRNDKAFANSYANFGKELLRSPFMFQTVLEIAGSGVEMNYSINNTYMSSYNVKYTTTNIPGRSSKEYTKPVASEVPGLTKDAVKNGFATLPPLKPAL